jgi:riboflavin synthase
MFTGIINNMGIVTSVSDNLLSIKTENKIFKNIDTGTSVSVDGVCLTLKSLEDNNINFQISNESINRSIIKDYKIDSYVNLETPVKANDFLSGHIVQGHVDEVAKVIDITEEENNLWEFIFSSNNSKYLVDKGSVTINGVSLTTNSPNESVFTIAVIDETYKRTNFQYLEPGTQVNIEYDILSKYIERLINDN